MSEELWRRYFKHAKIYGKGPATRQTWRHFMPYQILYFASGPVCFNREYEALDGTLNKCKSDYGEEVQTSVYLYGDGSKPWERISYRKQYMRKLLIALAGPGPYGDWRDWATDADLCPLR